MSFVTNVHRPLDVAKWFVLKAKICDAELSNLKLQKLMYYAQGRSLAVAGRPLFDADIEAWDHGPVVAEVYHAFKAFQSDTIPSTVVGSFTQDDFDREARRLLEAVWSEEGSKAAWVLRECTHNERPWVATYQAGARHRVISRELITEFFRGQHLARSLSIEDSFAEWADESYELAEEFLPAASQDW
ncbi:Panacea domain-containing protein [Rhodococcus opacus]|uniref:Panacea domain-containing protein n=1 Tax=Rhodococcus opacus TaxID=37919 RepID=UPI0024B8E55A|nr:type II toxin-antitoxin system antitoxin SocA domain-containing protein [Rhodococcus opacus]MDJ0413815.1 DUF4065 domain-containing protein [Rhodococcus opacus]